MTQSCRVFLRNQVKKIKVPADLVPGLVKAMVFPVVMYGCETWTVKKAERQRIDVFSNGTGEKAVAPHSSTLAWKIPLTEEPGGLQFMGSQRVRHS